MFGRSNTATLSRRDLERFYAHVCENVYQSQGPGKVQERVQYNNNKIAGMFNSSGGINSAVAKNEEDLIKKLVTKWSGQGGGDPTTLRGILTMASSSAAPPRPASPTTSTAGSSILGSGSFFGGGNKAAVVAPPTPSSPGGQSVASSMFTRTPNRTRASSSRARPAAISGTAAPPMIRSGSSGATLALPRGTTSELVQRQQSLVSSSSSMVSSPNQEQDAARAMMARGPEGPQRPRAATRSREARESSSRGFGGPAVQEGMYNPEFANRRAFNSDVNQDDTKWYGQDLSKEEQVAKYGFQRFKKGQEHMDDEEEWGMGKPDMNAARKWHNENVRPQMVTMNSGKTRRAEMGEKGVEYPIYSTTLQELSHFGLGVSMYFWYLKDLILLLIIMACIDTYNLDYFSSDAYSPSGTVTGLDNARRLAGQPGVHFMMRGSAVCTADTNVEAYMIGGAAGTPRAISATVQMQASYSANTVMEVHNLCQIHKSQGIVNLVSLAVFFLYYLISMCFYDSTIEELDEGMQTASDYTIVVQDPPAMATNPDDWKEFFEQFGAVAVVTVAFDNGLWMTKMTYLRYCRKMYLALSGKPYLPELDINSDPLPVSVKNMCQQCCGSQQPEYYLNEIVRTSRELKSMHLQSQAALHPDSDPNPYGPTSVCFGMCQRDVKPSRVGSDWVSGVGGNVYYPEAAENGLWKTMQAVFPDEEDTPDADDQTFYLKENAMPNTQPGAILSVQNENDNFPPINNVEFTLRGVLAHQDQQWDPATLADRKDTLPPEGQRASKVFITFQTEQGQRRSLRQLKTSKLDAWFDSGDLKDQYKFNWGDAMLMKDQYGHLICDSNERALVMSAAEMDATFRSEYMLGNALDAFYFHLDSQDGLTVNPNGNGNGLSEGSGKDEFVLNVMARRNEIRFAAADTIGDTAWQRQKQVLRRYHDVLYVQEAPEPTEVNWLNISWSKPFGQFIWLWLRLIMGLVLAACVVSAFYFIIKFLKNRYSNRQIPAIAISVANILLPPIMLSFTQLGFYWNTSLEQMVYFWKLLISRFITTAFINFALTDFNMMLDEDSIYRIQTILLADMVFTPFVKWFNPTMRFQQWWFAPRSKTQLAANLYYRGDQWYLADQYTNMIKTVFLVMFYAVLLPSGFWIAVCALIISYCVDKYMLLRRWVRKPEYGTELPDAARAAVFLCLLGGGYMSLYFYAGWPFDYACSANDNPAGPFWHCERNSELHFWAYVWPHVQGYMTHGQRDLVKIYRSIDAVVALLFIVGFLAAPVFVFFYDLVVGTTPKEIGDATDRPFSSVDEIQCYVPVAEHPGLDFPVIGSQVGPMVLEFPKSALPGRDGIPFNTEYVSFHAPKGRSYTDQSMLEDEYMQEEATMMKFSLQAKNGYPQYYSRVKEYEIETDQEYIEYDEEKTWCVCITSSGGNGTCGKTVAKCCACSFAVLATIAFIFICLAIALMHYCKHVDTSTVDSFEVPDTAFVDELLLANDSPHGQIQVVRSHFKPSSARVSDERRLQDGGYAAPAAAAAASSDYIGNSAAFDAASAGVGEGEYGGAAINSAYTADANAHVGYQDTVQLITINYAKSLADSEGLTVFNSAVYRNEYSYEEFASVTAFTSFNSRFRILGYNVDCKNVEMMARLPQQLPSLRRVVARAGWDTDVMFEMQDPYTLEIPTAFESVNVTVDSGDVEIKGLRTTAWGMVFIETEVEHVSPVHKQHVDIFNIQPNVLMVKTIMASVKMERVWMYDGGLLDVRTQGGDVNLENVVMYGHYGTIVVETYSAPITITLNARYFNGAFSLQSARGLVYVDPGQFMAYEGGSPEECSPHKSWSGMPTLRPNVPGHHSHCLQGRLGMAAGYNRLIAYSTHGNITVQFASFVEQPPGMYI